MLLSDLFDQLTYGELSQLELGGVDDEGIMADDHKRIIPHINLGLTEIYKRFLINTKEVHINCFDHIETYILDSKYAVSNTESTEQYKYISDSRFEPFIDDVLKIERVFNEDGQELHLNETDQYIIQTETFQRSRKAWSVQTPNYNTIQIPYPMETNALLVEYRADHEKIKVKDLNPETTEIHIPSHLLQSLLLFIAARAYSSLGGESAQDGMLYMQKFEASIVQVKTEGLINMDNTTNQRLEVSGWV